MTDKTPAMRQTDFHLRVSTEFHWRLVPIWLPARIRQYHSTRYSSQSTRNLTWLQRDPSDHFPMKSKVSKSSVGFCKKNELHTPQFYSQVPVTYSETYSKAFSFFRVRLRRCNIMPKAWSASLLMANGSRSLSSSIFSTSLNTRTRTFVLSLVRGKVFQSR